MLVLSGLLSSVVLVLLEALEHFEIKSFENVKNLLLIEVARVADLDEKSVIVDHDHRLVFLFEHDLGAIDSAGL